MEKKKWLRILLFIVIFVLLAGAVYLFYMYKVKEEREKKYSIYRIKPEEINKEKLKERLLGSSASLFPDDIKEAITYSGNGGFLDFYENGSFTYSKAVLPSEREITKKEALKMVESFIDKNGGKRKDLELIEEKEEEVEGITSYTFRYIQKLDGLVIDNKEREAIFITCTSEEVSYYKRSVVDVVKNEEKVQLSDLGEAFKLVQEKNPAISYSQIDFVYVKINKDKMIPVYKFTDGKNEAAYVDVVSGEILSL